MTVGLAPSEPSTSMGPVFARETQRAVDVRQPTPPNRDYATRTHWRVGESLRTGQPAPPAVYPTAS